MKKLLKLLIFFVTIAVLSAVLVVMKPYMSRICRLEDFGINIKVPYSYSEVESEHVKSILSLYNSKNGIKISALDMGKQFWSSGDVNVRTEEYLNVISAANYDASVKNVKKEAIEIGGTLVGRAEVEVVRPTRSLKTISLIVGEEHGSVVIEIYGEADKMNENKESIEQLIQTIKFSKNKHVYEEVQEENIEKNNSGEQEKSGEKYVNETALSGEERINESTLSGEEIISGEQFSGEKLKNIT